MAFRKTITNNYQPLMHAGNFGEFKPTNAPVSDSVSRMEIKQYSMKDLSKETLPLISADEIISSGKYINGNIDMSPSDPINELAIADSIIDYTSHARVNYQNDTSISDKSSGSGPNDHSDSVTE